MTDAKEEVSPGEQYWLKLQANGEVSWEDFQPLCIQLGWNCEVAQALWSTQLLRYHSTLPLFFISQARCGSYTARYMFLFSESVYWVLWIDFSGGKRTLIAAER